MCCLIEDSWILKFVLICCTMLLRLKNLKKIHFHRDMQLKNRNVLIDLSKDELIFFFYTTQNLTCRILKRASCNVECETRSITYSDSVTLQYSTLVCLALGINLLRTHDSIASCIRYLGKYQFTVLCRSSKCQPISLCNTKKLHSLILPIWKRP